LDRLQKFEAANVNVAYLSAKPPSPQKIASGSAWGDQLSGSTNRLIALCRRGAATLNIVKPAQWVRSYESFRGKELKKDLRSQRVGILTQEEVNHLARRFPGINESYQEFEEQLKFATIPWMVSLPTHIARINRSGASVEAVANTIIQQRLSSLLPSGKKQRERTLRKPMSVLIEELDGEDYINFFNPAMADSKPRFTVDIERLKVDGTLPLSARTVLSRQYAEYARAITDDYYRQYCISWFEATLASKLGL
jgi:ribosomal protein S7